MWKLSLPIGVDRDHEYCNRMVGGGSDHCDKIKELGWWVLVVGCDGDPLIDRQVELVEMLKKRGVQVEAQFNEGDYHGVELMDATKADSLFVFLKNFIEKILG
uniref:Alpha/beta hydrolase fold-3 domain-containing protein n=1 Tax=Fagus sylvatica TaxID=28930 RepID=A0A2N9ENH9_FAGSY